MTKISVTDERDDVDYIKDLCPGDFFYVYEPEDMNLLTGMDSINAEAFSLANLTKKIYSVDTLVNKYKEIKIDALI